MAHASHADAPTEAELAGHVTPAAYLPLQHPPLSPGKVAIWFFLATEVMFFTGLIGSYIVLRAGSVPTAYSNLFPPGTDLARLTKSRGVRLTAIGPEPGKVVELLHKATGQDEHKLEHMIASAPVDVAFGLTADDAESVRGRLVAIGAKAEVEGLKPMPWPVPYDHATNPLSIDLTAFNTFILICSSVSMVLALSAIQRGDRRKLSLWLACTVVVGACFLGIQVYEYRQLLWFHEYPPGVSKTGHFTPDVSLFASCFFTMTGFHGAHVAVGVFLLTCLFIGSLMGKFTRDNYSPVELIGLYWHFVDLVWILLFTVVYLI